MTRTLLALALLLFPGERILQVALTYPTPGTLVAVLMDPSTMPACGGGIVPEVNHPCWIGQPTTYTD